MSEKDVEPSLQDKVTALIAARKPASDAVVQRWNNIPEDEILTAALPKSAWTHLYSALMAAAMGSVASARLAAVMASGTQEDRDEAAVNVGRHALAVESAAGEFLDALRQTARIDGAVDE